MEAVLKDNVFRLLMKYRNNFLCFNEEYAEGEAVYQHEDSGKFCVNIYDSNFRWPSDEIIITSIVCEKENPGESFVKSLNEFIETFDGANYAIEVLSKTQFYKNRLLEDIKKAGIERHKEITEVTSNIKAIYEAAKTHPELTEILLRKIMECEIHLKLAIFDSYDVRRTKTHPEVVEILLQKITECGVHLDPNMYDSYAADRKEYYLEKIKKHNKYYPNFSVEKAIEQYKNNEWDWRICPECGNLSFPVNDKFFCTNCLDIVPRGDILNKEENPENFDDLLYWWMKPKEMLKFFDVFSLGIAR